MKDKIQSRVMITIGLWKSLLISIHPRRKVSLDTLIETNVLIFLNSTLVEYSSINRVWNKFQNMFKTISDVLLYLPAYRSYHWQMLEELYNDNVMYAEVRLMLYEV